MLAHRRIQWALVICCLLGTLAAGAAKAAEITYTFNLPEQTLADTLRAIGHQTTMNIVFTPEAVDGVKSPPIRGDLTIEQAVTRALARAKLRARQATANSILIEPQDTTKASGESASNFIRLSDASSIPESAPVPQQVHPQTEGAGSTSLTSNATNEPKPVSDEALEEIVVTAEKRRETVQSTPISITAITGQELQARGITSLQEAAALIPGISLKTTGPGNTEYEMRGLASTGGEAPTVGVYLDETPVTPPSNAVAGKSVIAPNLYDLARIEVLRGPQGTLYGAGSMGGTIKLVTNQPQLSTFAASAEAITSDTDHSGWSYGGNAMLNIPLIADNLALRLVASSQYTDGWISRIVEPNMPLSTFGTRGNVISPAALVGAQVYPDVNDVHLTGVRAALLFKPADALSITASAFYQKLTQGGLDTADSPPGAQYEAHYQPFNVPENYDDEFKTFTLLGEYKLDWFSITLASSYLSRTQITTQDVSENMEQLFGFPTYSAAGGEGIGAANIVERDYTSQYSDELRLTSTTSGPLQWLVGAFYSQFRSSWNTDQVNPGFATVNGGAFGTDDVFTVALVNHINQVAGFANVSYQLTDQFKATAGIRHYHYDSSVNSTYTGIVTLTGNTTPSHFSGAGSASGNSPMINLSYALTPDVLLYTSASRGFREGDGQSQVPIAGALGAGCLADLKAIGLTQSPIQYGPETVWSYELGEKAAILNQRVILNGDIFYEQRHNTQALVNLSCGYSYFDNAADANIYGAEVELKAKLTRQLTLEQSGSYIPHAAYSEANFASSITEGEKLLNVPNVTATTVLSYAQPLPIGYRLVASATNQYTGHALDTTFATNVLPSYDLVGVRLGLAGDTWSAYLFGNNLTNRVAILTNAQAFTANVQAMNRVATNQPLTIGLDFSIKF